MPHISCKFREWVAGAITLYAYYFSFLLWAIITRYTAMKTSAIPIPWLRLSLSPKTVMPTSTAVSGSIHPRIDVVVEPIICIAYTSVRSDMSVGTNARARMFHHWWKVTSGWKLSPFTAMLPQNSRQEKAST